jgi:hypothetical protein
MCLALVTVSDDTIEQLHADPPLVWALVSPDEPEAVATARAAAVRPGLIARLFGRAPAQAYGPNTLTLGAGEGSATDLDKAWHGIHYLLTGTAWEGTPPLNALVSGGRELAGVEVGYGAARTLTAAETRAFASALDMVSDADLRSRFAPAEMMRLEIYPDIWDRDPGEDDTLGYLLEYVKQLREYLVSAAAHDLGLLITLT